MLYIVIAIVIVFALGALLGAPWLPTRRREAEAALDLLRVKAGDTVLDLGSGTGSFLMAAARRGINAIGYEINPLLVLWSVVRCWPYRKLIKVKFANYWGVKLPPAEGIYVFLIGRYMKKLDKKLKSDLDKPTPVASYTFQVPGKEVVAEKNSVYLYKY